jgi:hypothetical protein
MDALNNHCTKEQVLDKMVHVSEAQRQCPLCRDWCSAAFIGPHLCRCIGIFHEATCHSDVLIIMDGKIVSESTFLQARGYLPLMQMGSGNLNDTRSMSMNTHAPHLAQSSGGRFIAETTPRPMPAPATATHTSPSLARYPSGDLGEYVPQSPLPQKPPSAPAQSTDVLPATDTANGMIPAPARRPDSSISPKPKKGKQAVPCDLTDTYCNHLEADKSKGLIMEGANNTTFNWCRFAHFKNKNIQEIAAEKFQNFPLFDCAAAPFKCFGCKKNCVTLIKLYSRFGTAAHEFCTPTCAISTLANFKAGDWKRSVETDKHLPPIST